MFMGCSLQDEVNLTKVNGDKRLFSMIVIFEVYLLRFVMRVQLDFNMDPKYNKVSESNTPLGFENESIMINPYLYLAKSRKLSHYEFQM